MVKAGSVRHIFQAVKAQHRLGLNDSLLLDAPTLPPTDEHKYDGDVVQTLNDPNPLVTKSVVSPEPVALVWEATNSTPITTPTHRQFMAT